MIKTILILIFTLILLPIFAFYFDAPLNELQSEILSHLLYAMLAIALLCFIVGEITKNVSQVDKLWSIVPIGYVWYITYASQWNERLLIMSVLVTIWGMRLTYNFSRRGAYKLKFWEGEEDYRWEVLRQKPALRNRWAWMLFNLFFICLYQMALILLFCLPALVALQGLENPLTVFDYILVIIIIALISVEFVADQQQWDYQTEKHKRIKTGKPLQGIYAVGFTHTGLWKYVRHPNYAAEQSIWIAFYFFSVAATGRWLNWSIAGCLLLIILFKGSSEFSEKISEEKYPDYTNYKKITPRFFPFSKLKKK